VTRFWYTLKNLDPFLVHNFLRGDVCKENNIHGDICSIVKLYCAYNLAKPATPNVVTCDDFQLIAYKMFGHILYLIEWLSKLKITIAQQ
jgi:hypothetical protein